MEGRQKNINRYRKMVREEYGIIYYMLPSGKLQVRRYNPSRVKRVKA